MKRLFAYSLPILLCALLLIGCTQSNNAVLSAPKTSWDVTEDITVSLENSTFPVGTSEFTVIFENRSNAPLLYGEEAYFEKFVNGEWTKVSTIENSAFNSIGYFVPGGETTKFTISTWFLAEPLSAGRYRVTGSTLYLESLPSQYPAYQLEFDIE